MDYQYFNRFCYNSTHFIKLILITQTAISRKIIPLISTNMYAVRIYMNKNFDEISIYMLININLSTITKNDRRFNATDD